MGGYRIYLTPENRARALKYTVRGADRDRLTVDEVLLCTFGDSGYCVLRAVCWRKSELCCRRVDIFV